MLPAETLPGTAAWRRARAREIIRDHALLAAAANAVPLPILGNVATGAVQLRMLAGLSRLYGADFDESLGRNLLASVGIGFVHHAFTRHTCAWWKPALAGLPVMGPLLAAAAWPAVFALLTGLLGEACARHYEAGGAFRDFTARGLADTPLAPLAAHFLQA